MKRFLIAFLLLLAAQAWAGEREVRDEVRHETAMLFLDRSFELLNERALQYRAGVERTPAGMLKSALYYAGIEDAAPNEPDDSDGWKAIHVIADEFIAAYPTAPWPYLAKAHLHEKRAWAYRGSGYMSNVSYWGRLRYEQEMKKIRDLLERHKQYVSSDPQYYAIAIIAAGAGIDPKERIRELHLEGAAKFPYYDEIYFAAANYYRPVWFGSDDDIENLAMDAVSRTRHERGYEMYVRVYWAAGPGRDGRFLFEIDQFKWGKFKQGMRDLLAHYPDQWNINHLGLFSCIVSDFGLFRDLLAELEEPILMKAWYTQRNFDRCRQSLKQVEDDPTQHWKLRFTPIVGVPGTD